MGRMSNSQASINYSPTIQSTVINGQEYVTVDQMNQAVSQGRRPQQSKVQLVAIAERCLPQEQPQQPQGSGL